MRDEDVVLLGRWREDGDRAARDELVRRHLPLARRLAARYAGRGQHAEDLQQVAAIGLLKAIDRFDPSRGVALTAFAVPTMLGELKRHLRDTTWAVRVPRDLQELALRVERESAHLERALGRVPTPRELAPAVGTALEDVLEAIEAGRAHHSLPLDAPLAGDDGNNQGREGGATWRERLGSEDPGLTGAEDRVLLGPRLARLDPREREILRLRFADDMTQSEIGARLGISQMHVSRLIRRALADAAR